MATIRDVARRAGVSVATVSHVLNSTRPVRPDTRSAVLNAVKDLSYRPSAVARGLTTNVTRTIGVVIADVTSPFFAYLLHAIEDLLTTAGYSLLLANTFEEPEREASNLEHLLNKRVDGVLITPTGLPQLSYAEFNALQIPLVFIDRRPPDVPGSFVGTDNEQAAFEVTRHLLALGHTRISLISLTFETSAVAARVAGYRRALASAGIEPAPELLVLTEQDRDVACRVTRELLDLPNPPTAIIAGSHFATLGALKALRDSHKRYPQDVSLVCFDNSQWTDIIQPSLTVVTKPIQALARAAVDTLLDSIAEAEKRRKLFEPVEALPQRETLLEAQLIVRESTGPRPARSGQ